MHHTRTRHAPTLPGDEITRADPRRPTHTIADPLSPLHLLERTQHNVSKAARLAGTA
jgi:hypothetical protein